MISNLVTLNTGSFLSLRNTFSAACHLLLQAEQVPALPFSRIWVNVGKKHGLIQRKSFDTNVLSIAKDSIGDAKSCRIVVVISFW